MTLILQAKRAAKDYGLYRGETEDHNWEPNHVIMWNRVCDKFGGVFTAEPTKDQQPKSFLDFLDNYKDADYTSKQEGSQEPATTNIKNHGGRNLKELIPDRQPVNTQDASKEDIRRRDHEVNKNANVKLPPSMQPPKQSKIPDPRKIVQQEQENVKNVAGSGDNKDAVDGAGENGQSLSQVSENGGRTDTQSTGKSEQSSENQQSNDTGTQKAVDSTPPKNPDNPFRKAGTESNTSSTPPGGQTIKVRG